MTELEPSDEYVDGLEEMLRRDLVAAIVELGLLEERARGEPPADLALSLQLRDQGRRIAELLGKPDEEWDITQLTEDNNGENE